MNNNLLVGQSGGPTSVINSSLAGVVKNGLDSKEIGKVYGMVYGIEGVLKDNIIEMDKFTDDNMIKLLMQTPSSYLGSCRKKLPEPEDDPEMFAKIFDYFRKKEIGYFFYIGGNDSMDTVNKLSRYASSVDYEIKIVGIPKTIDNDLAETDHTPGYGSAAKFVANSVRQLSLDGAVYDKKLVTVVEVMGRNAGWLTAASALAKDEQLGGPDIVCIPEVPFDMDSLLKKIEDLSKVKNGVVVAISEGTKDSTGKYLCEYVSKQAANKDLFNHVSLGGAGRCLENYIIDNFGFKVRTVEFSALQRCFALGGSLTDVKEAFAVGFEGVELAKKGMTGVMPGFKRLDGPDYKIEIVPFKTSQVANFEKGIPAEMITEDGYNLNEKFREYALPLIAGEPDLIYGDGLIKFAVR